MLTIPTELIAPALRSLGLTVGATADDVKRAFRERAKVAHPDAGGSEAAFVALQTTYEGALIAVGAERGR